jgi:hypothetical protein
MVSFGFSEPKMAFPATRISVPALIISAAFFKDIPPSTSIFAEDLVFNLFY